MTPPLPPRHRAEYSRANCTFRPPLAPDLLYQVVGGLVTDQTGQEVEGIERDADRDHYMTAKQAQDYGLVDHVVEAVYAGVSS